MAATLTQKLEQLDSIIKGAKKIQKQVMQTVVAENILRDDMYRFINQSDEELRDNIRYKGVIAKEKMRKPKEKKWQRKCQRMPQRMRMTHQVFGVSYAGLEQPGKVIPGVMNAVLSGHRHA